MTAFLTVLLVLTLLGVVGTLVTGIYGMTKGGDFNQKYGNKLMRARVILQGVALLLLALLMMSR